ncbi:hypothetical protein [Mycobacteroides franklinii]|uniref:hypothetical protein n=1 Tax=Mycobacteroides franklinii TaxID=948102 RepID=UPI00099483D8|nr:hypothetical protein [Mycobacteroides franklinii]
MSATPLQWDHDPDVRVPKNGCRAEVEGGAYVLFKYGADSWQVLFGSGWKLPEEVYLGDSVADAIAAANAHHAAHTRRLAWERYMAENDPPSNGEAL